MSRTKKIFNLSIWFQFLIVVKKKFIFRCEAAPVSSRYDWAWLMQDGMYQISQKCTRLDKPRRLTRGIGNCIVWTKRGNLAWYYSHHRVFRENLRLHEYCLMWSCQFSRFLGSKFCETKSQRGQVRYQALDFTGKMLNCVVYQ